VEALRRGEFLEGTPEAERYWRSIVPEVIPSEDSPSIPNWITNINMLATISGVLLFVIACIMLVAR